VKKKLLITGASGFLGYHLLPLVQELWEIHAIIHNKEIVSEKIVCHSVSLLDYDALKELFGQVKPDAVLHLAAVSNANTCELKPWQTWKINVEASVNLAKLSAQHNITFALTSTDLVFDGKKGNYTEQDEARPVNRYGKQKLEAEKLCLRYHPKAIIFRLPLMFGVPDASEGNYLKGLLKQYEAGKEISLFEDEYRSVCGAASVARGILELLPVASGIIHLAGADRLSRYDFGMITAEVFGLDSWRMKKCRQADVPMAAPRPRDVSLNSNLAFSYGYKPLLVREELLQLKSESDLS
jgi:dTDP-4-dehydrorhamnose reductase